VTTPVAAVTAPVAAASKRFSPKQIFTQAFSPKHFFTQALFHPSMLAQRALEAFSEAELPGRR
jgi:hypothetical protein